MTIRCLRHSYGAACPGARLLCRLDIVPQAAVVVVFAAEEPIGELCPRCVADLDPQWYDENVWPVLYGDI